MKKDKAWLKGKIKNFQEGENMFTAEFNAGVQDALEYVQELINQLDEPEIEQPDKKTRELESYNDELIRDNNQLRNALDNQESLSQQWIDENKVARIDDLRKMTTSNVVPVEKLKNLLVPKQEKPVIPKFVADWIESLPENVKLHTIFSVKNHSYEEAQHWVWRNSEIFARAWLDGYEVGNEPRWVVKIGKGYFSGYDETKVTYVLDDFPGEIDRRIVYDDLNEAESDANDIGGEVEEVTE